MAKMFDSAAALEPMFDDTVVAGGQSVSACVFPAERADPLADVSAESDALVTTVLVKRIGKGAWNDPSNPPKVGDRFTIGDAEYAVADVALFDFNYFTVRCKSV